MKTIRLFHCSTRHLFSTHIVGVLVCGLLVFGLSASQTARAQDQCGYSLTRSFELQFSSGPSVYEGTLHMDGCEGVFLVGYYDADRGRRVAVRQDMTAHNTSEGLLIRGANPVYADTGERHSSYAADNFLFSLSPDGDWSINTCDDQMRCSPVKVISNEPLNRSEAGLGGTGQGQGYAYHLTNECSHPVRLAIRYRDIAGIWRIEGWWTFDSGESAFLASDGMRLTSRNAIWYYFAETTDASSLAWTGDHSVRFDGRVLEMRRKEDREGLNELRLTCN